MLKRISAISAAVAGALLIGAGAQAASEGRLVCDRPLSSSSPANCVWQSSSAPAERVSVVTSSTGEPVRSMGGGSSDRAVVSNSERVLIVSEPASAGAPVYIIEPTAGSSLQRGDQVVVVTEPAIVESPRVIESSRDDAYPDPSPPSTIVEPRRFDRQLDPSDTRDRALGRHSQPE